MIRCAPGCAGFHPRPPRSLSPPRAPRPQPPLSPRPLPTRKRVHASLPRCARRPERLLIAATTRHRAPLSQAVRLLGRVNHGGGDRICLRRCSDRQRRRRRSWCGRLHGGKARTLWAAHAALFAAPLALGGALGAASLGKRWRGRLGRGRHRLHRRGVARSVTWRVHGVGECRLPP